MAAHWIRWNRITSLPFAAVLLASSLAFAPNASAEKVVSTEDFTLELGLRIQPRMELENLTPPSGSSEWQRDFLIRRTRLKAFGKMQGATYNLEWRIDRTDNIGNAPNLGVENGYVQIPIGGGLELKAGLYDQPFSRDRLTSDSKQLVVDRGAVSGVPDALGLADNVVGFSVLGNLRGGRAAYTVGFFDNRLIPGRLQDIPLVVGRLDLHFGSTQGVFQDAHFGADKWCSLGINGSFQGSLEDTSGADDGSTKALGVDGMVDVPTSAGRVFLRGEINTIQTETPTGAKALDTTVWMVGAGLLMFDQHLQPTIRFDRTRLDDSAGGGSRNTTYVGANFYRNGHNLKFQGDVRMDSGTERAVDGGRLQAQIDF